MIFWPLKLVVIMPLIYLLIKGKIKFPCFFRTVGEIARSTYSSPEDAYH